MCEQQYYIEYVLGIRSPSNKKADKGTIVHKVLEILACIKLAQQNKESVIIDDAIGSIRVSKYNLNTLIEKVYNYYISKFTHHEWELKDYKDCHSWVNKALVSSNGMFDPRNRTILQPEQHFDIEIKRDWAKFKYNHRGEVMEGNLAIKGTIDLITKIDDNTIEIIDWKTGKRLDWATGEEKTHDKLQNDPQLKIYHYAISQLYPHIEHVMVSINFINDGGPFTICYDKNDLLSTEEMLRKKFEIIKTTQIPRLSKTWKCTKLCHFGKTTFENSNIPPLIEYRDGQTTPKDKFMTKCEQIKHDTELKGINHVIDEYTAPGYAIGKYKAPGSVE